MKRTKSTLAMILAIVLCFTAVCPAMGAESVEQGTTLNENALETEAEVAASEKIVEDTVIQEESEDTNAQMEVEEPTWIEEPDGVIEQEMPVNQETVPEDENVEQKPEPVSEDETTDVVIEEPSVEEDVEESVEVAEPEVIEEKREAKSDSAAGESVAQAIWTESNATLTFYYGPQFSEGDLYGGETVTNVWSGTDITEYWTDNYSPAMWKETVKDIVKTVVFDDSFSVVRPRYTSYWFWECGLIDSVDLSGLDTSAVEDMSYMFKGCKSLTSLDLSSFDTSKVTNMNDMFEDCESLTSLDLRGFDTSSVKYMRYMFGGCKSLTSLDLRGLNTSSVVNMSSMFKGCKSLTSLDLSSFDTAKVTEMECMFSYCESLKRLELSSFDTSEVHGMWCMFEGCKNLTYLDVSSFDTSHVQEMQFMFSLCYNLQNLDISGFDTPNVENMRYMFQNCNSLTILDVSGFDTSKLDDSSGMFYGCDNLHTIYCANNTTEWDAEKSENMFTTCFDLVGKDDDIQVVYNNEKVDVSMAKAAGLGGYFTPKDSSILINIDSGFELQKDNNSFLHSTSNFLAPGEKHYCISDRLYGILKKKADLVQWAHLHDNRYIYDWSGSCAGLSIMMALIDNGIHDFFIHEAGSFYNISSPIHIGGLRDTINYYYLLYNCNIAKTDRTVNKGQNISEFLKSMVAEAKRGKPFIFLYNYNEKRALTSAEINEIMDERSGHYHPKGGHAVVVCGYKYVETNNGEKEHQVKIYDCNDQDSVYWMYISDDYSSFRYQDANMSGRATILDDPSRINLFSSFTSMDFITFSSIERESHALDAITKSNTLNHNMMLAEKSGEAYLASSSDSSDTTRVIISLDNPFVLTNEAGKSLTYDGIDISGDLPFYDSFISGEDYLELQFETDKSSRFTVSGYEEGTAIITQVGETVYSVDADKASDILIDEDAGVSISGNDVLFNVSSVNSINTDVIIAVSGNAESDCNIIRSDNSMIVTSDDMMSDVGIQVENDAGYKEYSIDSEKDNYIISYESDTPTATTKSEEGTFETVVISENGGEPVSASISSAEIDLSFETAVYTGEPLVPDITVLRDGVALQAGKDYSVSCENNTNVGTATITITGIGSYTGTAEKTFEITPKTITPTITLSQASFVYNGNAQKPSVTVKDGDNTILAEGTDYTVSYANNTNAGTASVVIAGKGNYVGSATKTFTINKAAQSITAKNFTRTYSTKAQTFSLGVKIKNGTPTYKSNSKSVTVSKAGKVTVKAKFIGKATITITAPASKNYTATTKKITITVNPTKTALSSVSSPSAGKMTVKWKKNAVGTGYQIQYSTSSKFTSPKAVSVTKNSTLTKTIGSLAKGKKYYVRIRTYKTVGKTKFYSAWSAAKTVTVKK